MATRAVLGRTAPEEAAEAAGAEAFAPPVIFSSTLRTISSIFLLLVSMSISLNIQRMHRLSLITHLRRLVKVAAEVSPSPVLLAIVKVQNPSPPNPIAA